jgi:hypothetical protein
VPAGTGIADESKAHRSRSRVPPDVSAPPRCPRRTHTRWCRRTGAAGIRGRSATTVRPTSPPSERRHIGEHCSDIHRRADPHHDLITRAAMRSASMSLIRSACRWTLRAGTANGGCLGLSSAVRPSTWSSNTSCKVRER